MIENKILAIIVILMVKVKTCCLYWC